MTDKERLEEIIKQVKRSDEYAEKGLWEASDRMIIHLHNEGHINYLTERVQELEEKLDEQVYSNKQLDKINRKWLRQNKRYREVIEKIKKTSDDYRAGHLLDIQDSFFVDEIIAIINNLEGEE